MVRSLFVVHGCPDLYYQGVLNAMLQTAECLAHYRNHFERQESDCFQKIRHNNNPVKTTVWSVYRMQIGSLITVGYTVRPRIPNAYSEFFYHADVCARTPPFGWITHKVAFSGFHEKITETILSTDNQIFHVCRIWGELLPPTLSCMPVRYRFHGQGSDPRVRGNYSIQLTASR